MLYGCAEPGTLFPAWGERPVEVEIGPGRGAFALDHAALHPGRTLVAIETRRGDCELIRGRAEKRGLRNLEGIQGGAKPLLPRMFEARRRPAAPLQISHPRGKTRAHKRRVGGTGPGRFSRRPS